jgi:hypothetical protein
MDDDSLVPIRRAINGTEGLPDRSICGRHDRPEGYAMRLPRRLAALPLIALAAFAAPAAAQDAEDRNAEDQDATAYAEPAPQDVRADAAAFEGALAPYGQWAESAQFGRVWLPAAARDPNWQPYAAGQWLWTDEYGWYWKSDEEFGWIVYHYGRWLWESTYGWLWIPGAEWAPAWVAWRQGEDYVGWTALPPERDAYDVGAVPDLWIFVGTTALARPDVRLYRFPRHEARVRFGASRYEGRAQTQPGTPIGSNRGIDPRLVAGASDHPLHRYEVRPRLFPNTVGLIGGRPVVDRGTPQDRPAREIVRRTADPVAPEPRMQPRPPGEEALRRPAIASQPVRPHVGEASVPLQDHRLQDHRLQDPRQSPEPGRPAEAPRLVPGSIDQQAPQQPMTRPQIQQAAPARPQPEIEQPRLQRPQAQQPPQPQQQYQQPQRQPMPEIVRQPQHQQPLPPQPMQSQPMQPQTAPREVQVQRPVQAPPPQMQAPQMQVAPQIQAPQMQVAPQVQIAPPQPTPVVPAPAPARPAATLAPAPQPHAAQPAAPAQRPAGAGIQLQR